MLSRQSFMLMEKSVNQTAEKQPTNSQEQSPIHPRVIHMQSLLHLSGIDASSLDTNQMSVVIEEESTLQTIKEMRKCDDDGL